MKIIEFFKCLWHGHSIECKANKCRFELRCTKCGLFLGFVNNITHMNVAVATSKDNKHYEIYGCSALDSMECTDKVTESIGQWYNGEYSLARLTLTINTDRLHNG